MNKFEEMSKFEELYQQKDQMVELLKILVEKESPSHHYESVKELLDFLENYCSNLDGETEWLVDANEKAQLRVSWGSGENQILILSHVDTVWPLGEVAQRPFQIKDGKALGPGILDMKAGIVQALFAVKSLVNKSFAQNTKIVMLFTIDEEIGSETSRYWIEQEAQKSCAVLVVEPSANMGKLKIARKGWALYEVHIQGKAAHAGNDPEKGANAILELTHQIHSIQSLSKMHERISVNVGVIEGGSRANIVAEKARAAIDIRFSRVEDFQKVQNFIEELKPINPSTTIEIIGGLNRLPMETTYENEQLFLLAKEAGREIGIEIDGVAVGGVSDGNFASNLGVPTLDGLGAVGEGPHALHEYIIIDEMVNRSHLLATLIGKIIDRQERV